MNAVKKHFEDEAKEVDKIIFRLIPYYPEMISGMVSAIPFARSSVINVIDLGCGTGTISKKIKENFPRATITCLDLAENMIEMLSSSWQISLICDIKLVISEITNLIKQMAAAYLGRPRWSAAEQISVSTAGTA